jgi:hypothetical protein
MDEGGGGEKYLLSYDIETTGPDVSTNFMITLGVQLVRLVSAGGKGEKDGEVDESIESMKQNVIATWYEVFPRPDGKGWDEKTLNNFWLRKVDTDLFNKIYTRSQALTELCYALNKPTYMYIYEKMWDLVTWIKEISKGRNVIQICDTVNFDPKWIDYYLPSPFQLNNILYNSKIVPVVDISSFYRGLLFQKGISLHQSVKLPLFESVCTHYNLKVPYHLYTFEKLRHSADYDALITALKARYILYQLGSTFIN